MSLIGRGVKKGEALVMVSFPSGAVGSEGTETSGDLNPGPVLGEDTCPSPYEAYV